MLHCLSAICDINSILLECLKTEDYEEGYLDELREQLNTVKLRVKEKLKIRKEAAKVIYNEWMWYFKLYFAWFHCCICIVCIMGRVM